MENREKNTPKITLGEIIGQAPLRTGLMSYAFTKEKNTPSTQAKQTPLGIPDSPGTTNAPGNWKVTEDAWVHENKHWTDTALGKAGIEFVSRITLGGLFYSLMENSEAMHRLNSYRFSKHLNKKKNNKAMALESVAHFLDKTVGNTLYKAADKYYSGAYVYEKDKDGNDTEDFKLDVDKNRVTKAREFVRFRETRPLNEDTTYGTQRLPGRSIGAEMTIVTASFAAMSAGSAIMRNILTGIFNPRERKAWTKDGKFDLAHIGKRLLGKTWEVVTYNAGEDMAVALPYVFYMRWQRNQLDKVWKGFKYSSDGVDNGGGLRINDKGEVVGHMLHAGAVDLQGRFTVYNVFTQMYRDLYNSAGNSLKKYWNGDMKLSAPEWIKDPLSAPGTALRGLKHITRYMAISSIRSIIQMTASVPFFSIFRISGSKAKGMLVHERYGALHFTDKDGNLKAPARTDLGGYYYDGDFVGHDLRYNRDSLATTRFAEAPEEEWFNNAGLYHPDYLSFRKENRINNPSFDDFLDSNPDIADKVKRNRTTTFYHSEELNREKRKLIQFDPYGYSKKGRALDAHLSVRMTDAIGKWMHKTAESELWLKGYENIFDPIVDKLGIKIHETSREKKLGSDFYKKRIAKDALMAGIPYASYFAMKTFMREDMVNDQSNMAIEEFVDGIFSLNRKKAANGVSEIVKSVMRRPLKDPERQAELVKRHLENTSDTSPRPTNWNKKEHIAQMDRAAEGEHFDKDAVTDLIHERRYADFKLQQTNRKHAEKVTKNKEERGIDSVLENKPAEHWKDRKTETTEIGEAVASFS